MKDEGEARDSGALSNPLSFIHSGRLEWVVSSPSWRGDDGYFWSSRSAHTMNSCLFGFYDTALAPRRTDPHGYGFAVRCVGLAPDSICPKGWQLPTYSGDKSFDNLIITSYSMNKADSSSRDSGVLSNPLSFLRSGFFSWLDAGLDTRGSYGYYWSLRSRSTTHSRDLYFGNTRLGPQSYDAHAYGFAVRRVQILHHSH